VYAAVWQQQRPLQECPPLPVHVMVGALVFFATHGEAVADEGVFEGLVSGVLVAAVEALPSSEAACTLLRAALWEPLLRGAGGAAVVRHLADFVLPFAGQWAWGRADVVAVVGALVARNWALLGSGAEPAWMGALAALAAKLLETRADDWLRATSESLVAAAAGALEAAPEPSAAVYSSLEVDLRDVFQPELGIVVGSLSVTAKVAPVAAARDSEVGEDAGRRVHVGVSVSLHVAGVQAAPLDVMRWHRVQSVAGQRQQQQQQQ